MENSPLLLLERERLDRDVTVLTGVFTMLKSQLENTKIEEVKESDFILILDPPEKPIIKSAPLKKIIVLKYAFSGVLIGILVAFIREFTKQNKTPIMNYTKIFIANMK